MLYVVAVRLYYVYLSVRRRLDWSSTSFKRIIVNTSRLKFVFFFFQAEDGIRDIGVTGVQTCALPIYPGRSGLRWWRRDLRRREARRGADRLSGHHQGDRRGWRARHEGGPRRRGPGEIGRASCRERV